MIATLVILGSTVTALAVARDAHAHGLTPVVVDHARGIAFASRLVRRELLAGEGEAEALRRVLSLADGGARCLVATGDRWLRFVVEHRAALDAAFSRVFHPANGALEICLGKARFAEWCAAHDLPVPGFWVAADGEPPAALRYPLIVRPAETQHGEAGAQLPKAAEVSSPADLGRLLERYRQYGLGALVTESLLPQRLTQYSVPFARAEGRLASFVTRKIRPAPESCAVGTCVELAPNAAVQRLAERTVEALDYYGVGEVEVLRAEDAGRDYLIEVNARPWLQYALAPASGHDFLGLLLDPASYRPGGTVTEGKVWIDFAADLYASFSRSEGVVSRGKMSFGEYLASIARANVFARFDWRDPWPGLSGLLRPRAEGLP